MPSFRYEAMDSTGEAHTGRIQAANADEAMSMLRTQGLFVTAMTEVTQSTDDSALSESKDAQPKSVASPDDGAVPRQRPEGWRWGLVVTAVGLICAAVGLYGVIEPVWFGIGAERENAKVVGLVQSGDGGGVGLLEFTAAGRQYRVPARGAWGIYAAGTDAIGTRHSVLYPPDRPEDARLAAFGSQYVAPLILLVLGFMFTPCGFVILRNGIRMTGSDPIATS